MNLPELRDETRIDEIIEIITFFAKNTTSHLWQDFTKYRSQLEVSFVRINKSEKEIVFECKDNPNLKFNPALSIYFYEKNKECIFKTEIIKMDNHFITIKIPNRILTTDKRLFTRTIPEEQVLVSFSLNKNQKKEPYYSKEVIDFSTQGLALKIVGREFLQFYQGDKISFNLDQCDIPMPSAVGTIMYAVKEEETKITDKISYRVGVCFL